MFQIAGGILIALGAIAALGIVSILVFWKFTNWLNREPEQQDAPTIESSPEVEYARLQANYDQRVSPTS